MFGDLLEKENTKIKHFIAEKFVALLQKLAEALKLLNKAELKLK